MSILPRKADDLVHRVRDASTTRMVLLERTNATVTKKMMLVIGGTGQYRRP